MFHPLSLSLADACSGNVNSSAPPPLRVHSLCSETASRRDNRIRGGLGRTLRMFSRSVPCPKSVQLAFLFGGTIFSPYACLESSLKQLLCTALTQLPSGCALSEQEKPFKQFLPGVAVWGEKQALAFTWVDSAHSGPRSPLKPPGLRHHIACRQSMIAIDIECVTWAATTRRIDYERPR